MSTAIPEPIAQLQSFRVQRTIGIVVDGYSVWRDILGLAMAFSLLEAALMGRGTAMLRHRRRISFGDLCPDSGSIRRAFRCRLVLVAFSFAIC
jgi:hypothetical protein